MVAFGLVALADLAVLAVLAGVLAVVACALVALAIPGVTTDAVPLAGFPVAGSGAARFSFTSFAAVFAAEEGDVGLVAPVASPGFVTAAFLLVAMNRLA